MGATSSVNISRSDHSEKGGDKTLGLGLHWLRSDTVVYKVDKVGLYDSTDSDISELQYPAYRYFRRDRIEAQSSSVSNNNTDTEDIDTSARSETTEQLTSEEEVVDEERFTNKDLKVESYVRPNLSLENDVELVIAEHNLEESNYSVQEVKENEHTVAPSLASVQKPNSPDIEQSLEPPRKDLKDEIIAMKNFMQQSGKFPTSQCCCTDAENYRHKSMVSCPNVETCNGQCCPCCQNYCPKKFPACNAAISCATPMSAGHKTPRGYPMHVQKQSTSSPDIQTTSRGVKLNDVKVCDHPENVHKLPPCREPEERSVRSVRQDNLRAREDKYNSDNSHHGRYNYDHESHIRDQQEANYSCGHRSRHNEKSNCQCCHRTRKKKQGRQGRGCSYGPPHGYNLAYQDMEEYPELVQEIENTISQNNKKRVRKTRQQFEIHSRQNRNLDKPICDEDEDYDRNCTCDDGNCRSHNDERNGDSYYCNQQVQQNCCNTNQSRCDRILNEPTTFAQPRKLTNAKNNTGRNNTVNSTTNGVNQHYPNFPNETSGSHWEMNKRTGEWYKVCGENDIDECDPPTDLDRTNQVCRDYEGNYHRNQCHRNYYQPKPHSPVKRFPSEDNSCKCRNCTRDCAY